MDRITITANIAGPWRLRGGNMEAEGVLIRQGVWCGSHGCILHPGETIRNSVRAWNRTPVSLYHPMVDNTPVSIRHNQEIFNRHAVGHLENVRFEDGKLKARVVVTSDDNNIRQLLQECRELSTGMFSDNIDAQGTYDGKQYHSIAQNYTPDHLALLPGGEGACSWERSECGLGINKETRVTVNEATREIYRNAAREILSQNDSNFWREVFQKEKGENTMTGKATLLPPIAVNKEEESIDTKAWEKWEAKGSLMPANIRALLERTKTKQNEDDRRAGSLLPPGVE